MKSVRFSAPEVLWIPFEAMEFAVLQDCSMLQFEKDSPILKNCCMRASRRMSSIMPSLPNSSVHTGGLIDSVSIDTNSRSRDGDKL